MSRTSYGAPVARYRAATDLPLDKAAQRRCDGCRQLPRHPGERADLTIVWILEGSSGPEFGHFCRRCAPAGPFGDLICARCGDGPLLAGEIVERPQHADSLLTTAGWQLAGPTCPECAPRSSQGLTGSMANWSGR